MKMNKKELQVDGKMPMKVYKMNIVQRHMANLNAIKLLMVNLNGIKPSDVKFEQLPIQTI